MPTLSRIREPSFRIGSGRYLQDSGIISTVGDEVLRLHAKRPLIIGGRTALSLTRAKVEESLSAVGIVGEFVEYGGFCCVSHSDAVIAKHQDTDIVIGIGGGNIMDAAKYMAAVKDVPVINIPTSSATCAAFTPLSVCYTEEGGKDRSFHHKREVDCVIADTEILCRQPVRLLLAGIYDSLAKIYELKQRMLGVPDEENDIGLRASYALSGFAADLLRDNMGKCIEDVKNGRNTKVVYDTVYVLIALTGVISGLARGSNQCALGHAVYESARTLYPREVYSALHGELVAIGLIVQNIYNGDVDIEKFIGEMRALGMPTTLSEVGVPACDESYGAFCEAILKSTAMAGTTDGEQEKFKAAFKKIM